MNRVRIAALSAALAWALVGCPGGEQGPDGCPHADDTRATASTCWHPGPGGEGRVYHSG